MKKIATTLLLFIFLYNIIGYYFSFSFFNLENRFEMSQRIRNEKNLQTIRIPKSEIKNVVFSDDGNEMSYNGNRYDIKDRSQDGNFIVLQCLNDNYENDLLVNLDKHVQNNLDTRSSSGEKQNKSPKNPITDLFCIKPGILILDSSLFSFRTINCKLQTVSLSFLSPPPKQV